MRCASISVPTLDDFPNTPVVVYGITPWSQASWTVTPPMLMEPGTCSTSSGLDSPYSITDDAVTILFTEPGSNGDDDREVAQLPLSWRPMSWLGSKVLSFDIASTSPVFASSTTAETFLAPETSLACCTCCWT